MELQEHSNRIHLLPEHIIDQIKAGEVVERPANVLKELLENAIDAKANEVKITIRENGLELLAIEDNGEGIGFEELPYAFCRHATSKITSFDDIYRLNTFGFRGEALASISSVSRISCHSAPKENTENGGKFVIHGAQTIEHSHYKPSEYGTSIFVKDLFFNTPVRLKFVKSKQSEKNALKRVINAFLVTYPHVKFSISWDGEDKDIYPMADSKEKRILQIINTRARKYNILSSSSSYLGVTVNCYVSAESSKGYSGKHHYLFVNNRLFTDKKIHQIVIRNMEKLWNFGQTGHYFVEIHVPENEIDVNVHPNKTLIKFLKATEIFSLISASVKKLIEENRDIQNDSSNQANQELTFETQSNYDSLMNSNVWERSFKDQDYQNSAQSLGQGSLFSGTAQKEVLPCGSNIYILKEENEDLYFLNMDIGMSILLEKISKMSDVPRTPLLISEPIELTKIRDEEKVLHAMDDLGFEIDRIDEHTLVLRSTPTLLEKYSYTSITTILLSGFAKGMKEFNELDFSQQFITDEALFDFLGIFSTPELIREKALKKVSGSDIKKKFYGKRK